MIEYTLFAAGLVLLYVALMPKRYRSYEAYRMSPAWRKLRARAKKRDQYRCVLCNSSENLHVHHRRYGKTWGTETLTDVYTLCEFHHSWYHALERGEYRFD